MFAVCVYDALTMAKAITPQTYSVKAAAKVLGVPGRTIYGQVARGELPAIRLSGRILILRAVIDEILASGLPKPEPVPADDEQW
jgi:excisionase family DNA binding protein